ncbi:DUF3194 domain-containing protein [Methanothermobacter wolfeii]|uniref:DUF3194 domain-containing protein n=2 Tax=Methanothermobacter TaxID=145260 RepID=A0A9E7RS92_METWO|nr:MULTISPECIES: DUF3194 domain-containing protein [Methanothermobacter]ADL58657.1 conserved hypothetical protein [Methanothermobacter marburgensis str. Marburg]NLM03146.1 DUF3194 domain-containing protein [Methanothermobacter wolfeii]QHN06474.1 DUF3194 domain-containing protein [Methanothermobacter sp. THM-1]QHN07516.1 DUF3194 domain-containing protein [Methanothermobacter sp. THM-2]UXH30976.1 DUF3194 domain-containing protein [Methanothermobacter wolfeii]
MTLRRLSRRDLDEISIFLHNTVSEYILQRVPRKEIVDLDVSVRVEYDDELSVDISAEVYLDELSDADPSIVDEAVDLAYERLEDILEDYRE